MPARGGKRSESALGRPIAATQGPRRVGSASWRLSDAVVQPGSRPGWQLQPANDRYRRAPISRRDRRTTVTKVDRSLGGKVATDAFGSRGADRLANFVATKLTLSWDAVKLPFTCTGSRPSAVLRASDPCDSLGQTPVIRLSTCKLAGEPKRSLDRSELVTAKMPQVAVTRPSK